MEKINQTTALKLSIETQLKEATDELSQTKEQSETSNLEAKMMVDHLTRNLEEVDDEIRVVKSQLHSAKLEQIQLKAEAKKLALENERHKTLLAEIQSPLKAPRQVTSASSSVTSRVNEASAESTRDDSKGSDEENGSDDDSFDLNN